ncbi:uncharacterized protein [Spinacia oleracea]|uniref:Uncharacterized protein n=1 Tax=Spinacia oleracea TaxID=3562 RepID=A0ABM3QMD8_SPIOL|nr:uncharacterized protein LOC130460864 [Spinacia oleracea]
MQRFQAADVDVDSLSDTIVCVKEKFQGVDVSSLLIPVLQKVWDKHGNIMQGHVVNSDSLLTWALESLAKIIVILQRGSGMSLNDSQAKYLYSTLLDLRPLRFKLDWLVPFVEKALALHKNKEKLEAIIELEATKSKLVVEMREVKERLCEVEERLDEQRKLVPESLLVSAPLDVKDLLG